MKFLILIAIAVSLSACASPRGPAPTELAKKNYSPSTALLLAKLADIAYEADIERVRARLDEVGFRLDAYKVADIETSSEGIIAYNDEIVVLAFRGTQEARDFIQDAKFEKYRRVDDDNCDGRGYVHGGFNLPIIHVSKDQLLYAAIAKHTDAGRIFFVTGHSLGAALSNVFAYYLTADGVKIDIAGIYTFGQPVVGDSEFAECFERDLGSISFRHVNNTDIVTRLKPPFGDYRHIGTLIHFGRAGRSQYYNSWSVRDWFYDIVSLKPPNDHRMVNYIRLLETNENDAPLTLEP